jgi:hypothetical protein
MDCPGKDHEATVGSRECRQDRDLLVPVSGDDLGLSRKKDSIGEDDRNAARVDPIQSRLHEFHPHIHLPRVARGTPYYVTPRPEVRLGSSL